MNREARLDDELLTRLAVEPGLFHLGPAGEPLWRGLTVGPLFALSRSIAPGMRTLETGCGGSTVVFAAGGALAGGTAFNPFGDALSGPPIPSNFADVAYATIHPKDVDTSEIATLDLNIYTTSLFKLPAGGVGLAFGGQFRREQLTQDVDQINIDADIPGNSPSATTNAGRKDYAFYAEADFPIFSPTFAVPGAYSLNLTAAMRYSGRQYATIDNVDFVPNVFQAFDSFLVVDLRAQYKAGENAWISLGIDNVNNAKYHLFHPFPHRTFLVGLKFGLQ